MGVSLIHILVVHIFISAWAILLFVQQYRAILTASECGSDSRRFTLFLCLYSLCFNFYVNEDISKDVDICKRSIAENPMKSRRKIYNMDKKNF